MAVSAASLTHLIAQTDPTEILVEKVIAHTQTGASNVNVDSGNPYTFYAEVIMDSGSYSGDFTVGGANKTLADQGGGEYLFTESFSSQGDMDAAYANDATYSFTNPGGTAFTFDQTNGNPTFEHANAPVVTLGGGNWVGNVYQIDASATLSVSATVNAYSDADFLYGYIDLFDDVVADGDSTTVNANLVMSDNSIDLSGRSGSHTLNALNFYGYSGTGSNSPLSVGGELDGALTFYGLGSMTSLTIDVVPEPSQAALLIGIVAIAMVGLRRRANS